MNAALQQERLKNRKNPACDGARPAGQSCRRHRARHLTRATWRQHVSQPAVSARIRALQDELGVPQFERSVTGMTLT